MALSKVGKNQVDQSASLTVDGDLTVDTNTLYVDSTNNRVGIGTSSPSTSHKLTLDHTSNYGGISFKQSGTQVGQIIQEGGTGNIYIDAGSTDANGSLVLRTNFGSERLRIDSSGNLLVGKTSVSTSTAGFEVRSDGLIYSGRDGNEPLILNRLTSDGNIVDLRKDGSTVGSIGVLGGIMDIDGGSSLGVGAGDTGLLFTASSDDIRPFNVTTGSSRDAAIDLGTSSRRFKDLYLSGGVYLGGTGSANYLDDYEFGFYTPSYGAGVSSGSQTYSQRTGVYTKIGNIVKVWVDMTLTANSGQSGQPYITLPFTSASAGQLGTDSAGHQRFEMGSWNSWATDNTFTGSDTTTGWITTSSSLMFMYRTGGTSNPISGWSTNATGRISGTIWYTTA